MGFTPDVEDVFAFLQDPLHPHGVLAYTNTHGNPDTAFVAFSATNALHIIFGTSDASRKFGSLRSNPNVGFNVTDVGQRLTVQLTGEVSEIDREAMTKHGAHYAKLGERSRRFEDLPDQHFFVIRTRLLRFSDCLEEPWTVAEIIC